MSTPDKGEISNVSSSDDPFTARMRFHQSWYRQHILQREAGPNPTAKGKLYGNMLTSPDGKDGWNFLNEEIFEQVNTRLKEDATHIDRNRLKNNLLSSQPMCFNLFGPLVKDLALATTLFSVLPGLPKDITIKEIGFEFAPDPKTHLGDGTSFDAYATYVRPSGVRGIVGIETKLTEPFSQLEYKFEPRYSQWMNRPGWLWKANTETLFSTKLFNQLWRNHLLAFAMLNQPKPAFEEAYCAVVHHKLDAGCSSAIKAYKKLLKSEFEGLLLDWPLLEIINIWKEHSIQKRQQEWLAAFYLRYLDLEASEPAWIARR